MSEAILNTIGIGRIMLDGRVVAGFRYELDDARLAAALLAGGIGAKLYSGKTEGRILDLARQLARMRTDAYIIFVTPDTLGAVAELVTGLQLMRPNVQVLFWGSAAGTNPGLNARVAALGDWIASDNPYAVLKQITGTAVGAALPSPYLSGLLATAEVTRLGLVANQGGALLADELQWLSADAGEVMAAVPLAAQQLDQAELRTLALALSQAAAPLRFALYVHASACTSEVLALLPTDKLVRLVISGDLSDLHPPTPQLAALIMPADEEPQRLARAAVYGKNANIVLHTGFYFDAKQAPGIYHLEVPLALEPAQRATVYAWAGSSMDIRSAAILKGTTTQVDERLDDFIAPLSLETGGWPKHSYALGDDGAHGANMTFDGVTSTRQAVRYVPLSELEQVAEDSDALTFVTMKTARDADALEQRLAMFQLRGEIRIPHLNNGVHLENSCRWMSYGACRLPLLRRIEVHPSMRLSSCRDAGEVGVVGDAYDQIVTRVKQRQQMEEVRRGCASCRVRDQCSHCSQLPDAWGGRYCEIRQSYEYSALYMELFSYASMLMWAFKDVIRDEMLLKVSHSGLPAQHYHGEVGTPHDGLRPLILTVRDRHLAWWRGTRKFVRLSAPLAMMAEAWWAGAFEEQIVASLVRTFKVDGQLALHSLAEGMSKLRGEGIIHA